MNQSTNYRFGKGASNARIVSGITSAIETVIFEITLRHPEVPDGAVLLWPCSSARSVTFAYCPQKWQCVDGMKVGEFRIAAEGLGAGAAAVFADILHAAAVAAESDRRGDELSRGGRYHDKRMAARSMAFGLEVEYEADFGWCIARVLPDTLKTYEAVVAQLDHALVAYRLTRAPELSRGGADRESASDRGTPEEECDRDERRRRNHTARTNRYVVEGRDLDDDERQDDQPPRGHGRSTNPRPPADPPRPRNGVSDGNVIIQVQCRCEDVRRTFPVSAAVYRQGAIICGLCREPFAQSGGLGRVIKPGSDTSPDRREHLRRPPRADGEGA